MVNMKVEKFYRILMNVRGSMEMVTAIKLIGYLFLLIKTELDKIPDVYAKGLSLQNLSALYGDPVEVEDLVSYMRDVEKSYGLPSGMVSTELQYILRDADEDTMLYIFRILSEMKITNEEIADVYSSFLYRASSEVGKSGGLYGTRSSITKLHAGLLQVKPGMTVYDPFCGIGGVVSAVDKETELCLQDLDMTVTPLAAINAILHGIPLINVQSKDSFLSPGQRMRFDRITCFPPMNLKMSKEYLEEACVNNNLDPQMASSDTIAVWNAFNNIKDDGIAIVQVPAGFLYKGGKTAQFREWGVKNKYIDSVIELPSGSVMHTTLKTAFVILKKCKSDDNVLLIDTESLWTREPHGNGGFKEESIERILEIYYKREESDISTLADRETILTCESKLTRQSYMVVDRIYEMPQIDSLLKREAILSKRYEDITNRLGKMRKEEAE